ncbi:hypothetical protein SAMN05421862_10510 [Pseudomonas extremaustralis]|nr:hypothetical protein SAMN05421862_10510 [Pseudomonas extremaustralis]
MHQNYGRSVVLQGDFDHLPRRRIGNFQRPFEQLPESNNPMLGIEQQQSKDFVFMELQQRL